MNSSIVVGCGCGPIGMGVHVHWEVVGRAAAISDMVGKDIARYPSNKSPRKMQLLISQDRVREYEYQVMGSMSVYPRRCWGVSRERELSAFAYLTAQPFNAGTSDVTITVITRTVNVIDVFYVVASRSTNTALVHYGQNNIILVM